MNNSVADMEKAQRYLDVAAVIMLALDKQGKITMINKAGQRILGYSKKDIIGHDWFAKFVPPDIKAEIKNVFLQLMAGKTKLVTHYDNPIITKGGKKRIISWYNTLLKNKEGKTIGILSSGTDITEGKKQKDELELMSLIVEQSQEGIAVIDMKGKVIFSNSAFAKMHGYQSNSLVGKDVSVFHTPEQMPSVKKANQEIEKKGFFSGVIWHKRKNGSVFPALMNNALLKDSAGVPIAMVGTLLDITKEKEVEKALKESAAIYRAASESTPDCLKIVDLQGKIIFANKSAIKNHRCKKKPIGKSIFTLQPQIDLKQAKADFNKAKQGKMVTGEYVGVFKNGDRKNILRTYAPVKDGGKKVKRILVICQDITKTKEVEEKLRESEEKYRLLYETSSDAIMTLAPPSWKFTSGNPAIVKMFGVKNEAEFIKLSPWQISPKYQPDGQLSSAKAEKMIKKAIKTGKNYFEWTHKTVTGREFYAMVLLNKVDRGKKSFLQARVSDITERKKALESLRASEKRFQDIALSSADWIWEVNAEGKYSYVSGKVEEILGYQPEEIVGKTPFELMPEAEAKRVKKIFHEISQHKKPLKDLENWNLAKNGQKKLIVTNGVPIINGKGKLAGYRGVDKDITEERLAEEKMSRSEEQLRAIFNSTRDMMVLLDNKGKVLRINKAVTDIAGYTSDELLGKMLYQMKMFTRASLAKILSSFARRMLGQKIPVYTVEANTKSGGKIFLEISVSPFRDEKGKRRGNLATLRDVTERIKMEEDLKVSEAKLKSIISSIPDLVFALDKDLNFTECFALPEQEKYLPLNPQNFIGKNVNDVLSQEFLEVAISPIKKALHSKICTQFDYLLPTDHQHRYYSARACHRSDAEGKVAGVTIVSRDITQRKLAEQNLEKFKLAVASATDQIIITDPEGVILFANEATAMNTGYLVSEIIGKRPSLWGKQMSTEFYENMWQTIKVDKRSFSAEVKNKDKQGGIYDASIRISPILDKEGEVSYFVGIERDITREKEIDKAKTEFVSLASHQLRNPLTAINWNAEMLLGLLGESEKKGKEFAEEILDSGQRMSKLVNALLNVSRLEMGTYAISPEMTDIETLIDSILEMFKQQISSKNLKVIKNYAKKIPSINVDPQLLGVVIENIISNAVKYTPSEGKINLLVSQDKDVIKIEVKDNGCGIPRQQQSQIFRKMFRADNALSIDPEGHGLGLYVAKSIMDKAGGSIAFHSEENKGTSFWIEIPKKGMKKQTGKKVIISTKQI